MAAYYTFEDLSGAANGGMKSDNPYQDVICDCDNDPTKIQQRYHTHRTARNAQQKAKLLAPGFQGVIVDQILAQLENPDDFPGYVDPRNCLVFWARPTRAVKKLIAEVQSRLREIVPNLWLMPAENLHMTALEVTHSLTSPEIEDLIKTILPRAEEITDSTLTHRARLVKPMVSFDAQALALSFLPAAGESGRPSGDEYTYHHLRRDLFAQAGSTGVTVTSRYVIPSAHLTIGRFTQKTDLETNGKLDPAKMNRFIDRIDEVNEWLAREFWPREDGCRAGGEWIVGEEKGLDFRKGTLWYGAGETVRLGKGS